MSHPSPLTVAPAQALLSHRLTVASVPPSIGSSARAAPRTDPSLAPSTQGVWHAQLSARRLGNAGSPPRCHSSACLHHVPSHVLHLLAPHGELGGAWPSRAPGETSAPHWRAQGLPLHCSQQTGAGGWPRHGGRCHSLEHLGVHSGGQGEWLEAPPHSGLRPPLVSGVTMITAPFLHLELYVLVPDDLQTRQKTHRVK